MRVFFPLIALLTWTACSNDAPATTPLPADVQEPQAPVARPPRVASPTIDLYSLEGTGLKFHGVYDAPSGNLHYYMRFFERGNVALVAGQQEPNDPVDLKSYLTQDAKSGTNSVHNVPVTRRNDSLFFTTMATRGAIHYAGVVDGDSLRFNKRSDVTGKQAVVVYGFIPD
ncbi:MAG: hypothetical protein K8H89_02630 [Flavobacteriales bacterium]|jgi:hypothetical protein|nr:hypothetical protein [Flavobacteriales bacterium]MCB0758353.1 hypothetical protein [Flavobacteriales bacterium]